MNELDSQPDSPPLCLHPNAVKKGFYQRKCDSKHIQRFWCTGCQKHFSTQTGKISYRQSVVREIPEIRKQLCSGVSQRRIALNLGIDRKTVARKIHLLFVRAATQQSAFVKSHPPFTALQFDEIESFEHTKLKPLSIPIVVTPERYIIALGVASAPAKGPLARLSRKKYGRRRDDRRIIINRLLASVGQFTQTGCDILTDKEPRYPKFVKSHFPSARHRTTDGGRGCIAGFGELKKKGFDPMFSLNHTAASIRDGLATLKRKTWTTTKKAENLVKLLAIYAWYHNSVLVGLMEKVG